MASQFEKDYAALAQQLGRKNGHAVPQLKCVVVNAGVGKRRDDKAAMEAVAQDLARITGQKPQTRTARKAVAGFNVRAGNLVGMRVTLRGKRMEDFVQRFVNATLPRVRDFRGLPVTALDRQGNLNVGLKEQLAFPEVRADQTDEIFGLQVTFVTSAKDKTEGEALFRQLGFPLVTEAETEAGSKKKKNNK